LQLAGRTTLSIDAISATTAFVVGLNYDPTSVPPPPNDTTFIWRTTNGGITWSSVFAQLHGYLNAVQMISATEGIGVGDPVGVTWTVIRTTDSGETWARIPTEPTQIGGEYGWFRCLSTNGLGHIWFGTYIGSNSPASVYHSTDEGATWGREETPLSNGVFSVWFNDSLHGICSGDSISARSTDGGITWATIDNLPGGHWYNDLFPTVSIAGGKDFWVASDSIIYRSTDLGISWNISYIATNDRLTFASFVTVDDSTAGWVTGLGVNIFACKFQDPTDVHETTNGEIPTEFELSQNYPNPFNPSTTFSYSIPAQSKVVIKVYDILGNEIAALMDEEKSVGTYELTLNAENLPSGVYFYQLKAEGFVQAKKMLLLK
jgi:photosystem II stability/assembly factor-like uncharacterized protein